jgi:hypothetical protein
MCRSASSKTRAPVTGALLALAGASAVLAHTPTIDISTKAIVAAASAYVEAYDVRMQYLLADEVATQRVTPRNGADETRTTRADFFLTFLPAESTWIAVRDVRSVDGAPVNDPDNIRALIDRAPLARLGAVIADKNSRFNIGNISRTFNEPTLALLVVTAKHRDRFRFERTHVTDGPSPRVTIAFTERDRPTLVSGINGAPVFSTGELVVDAATGRVEATTMAFRFQTATARIETHYSEDTNVGMWVPSVMRETYAQTARGHEQTIRCASVYTNYRKFETAVIIK